MERQGITRRIVIGALGVTTAVVGPFGGPAAGASSGAAACTWSAPTPLPLPAGYVDGTVTGTDGAGRFVGTVTTDPGDFTASRAAVWSGGRVTVLPSPTGTGSWGSAVNRSGDVVGVAVPDVGPTRPMLWRGGVPTPLGVGTGDEPSGTARDISDAGLIVGEVYTFETGSRPALWSAAKPGYVHFVPAAGPAVLSAVTATGRVGGYLTGLDGLDQHAAVGTAGGIAALPDAPGTIGAATTDLAGDHLVGNSAVTDVFDTRATVWRDGTPTLLSAEPSEAWGVNAAGLIAGARYVAGVSRPVVWSGRAERTLPGGTGTATTVTDAGRVGGHLSTATGRHRPVTWACA